MLAACCLGACAVPTFDLETSRLGFDLPAHPVLLVYVDGVRQSTFLEMLEHGELPLLERYLIDRGVAVQNAITCVPSVTFANATAMVTGQYPSHNGIFANRWFDRRLLASQNYETAATMGDINHDFSAPTIYEMLDGRVTCDIGMQIKRGAQIALVTTASDGGLPAGIAWELGQHERLEGLLVGALTDVGQQSRLLGHWPDLTMLYLPEVDAIGHTKGPDSPEYRQQLRDVDRLLGGALRTLDEAGLLDKMTVVLTSDHGHHEVDRDSGLDIDAFLERLGISTWLTNSSGEERADQPFADRVRLFSKYRCVATHSGERYASLHLRSEAGWEQHPTFEEILSYHHPAPGADGAEREKTFPELLVSDHAIEFVAVRVSDEELRLWGKNGIAAIWRQGADAHASYGYRVVQGQDPLDYASHPEALALSDGKLHPSRAWLEATAALAHPDVVPQLAEAFQSPRAGDVMIFAAKRWDFSRSYSGVHGGIERDEMQIPMYFAGPGLPHGGTVPAARLVDLVPTVLELMDWHNPEAHPYRFDGISIASQLRAAVPRIARP